MSPHADLSDVELSSIEGDIADTRAALDRKIDEIERRLDPRQITMRVREKLDPNPYLGWIAASAVAVGSLLAARGLRRRRPAAANRRMRDESWEYIDCVLP
jgi:hypothetical protein